MKPIVLTYVLGPLENNSYLLADPDSRTAALIDPSYEVETALADARRRGLDIRTILLTHAHFDHIAGVAAGGQIPVALHPADLELYRRGGGAAQFGMPFEPGPEPAQSLAEGQVIQIGAVEVVVHHTPGHTPGHVIFVCAAAGVALCGDVIFAGSVGRTDLPGASHAQLMDSIRRHILTLPPETVLLPGHGPATTMAEEKEFVSVPAIKNCVHTK